MWGCHKGGVAVNDRQLLERLLAQNERLIEALVANQPVEVIKAMNPPAAVQAPARETVPWSGDPERDGVADPWGDPDVSNETLIAMGTGWVGPGESSRPEPQAQQAETGEAESFGLTGLAHLSTPEGPSYQSAPVSDGTDGPSGEGTGEDVE